MAFNIEQISKNAFAEAFAQDHLVTDEKLTIQQQFNYQPEKAKPKRKTKNDKPVSGKAAAGKGRGRPKGSKRAIKTGASPPPAIVKASPPLPAITDAPPTAHPIFSLPSALATFPSLDLDDPLPTIHLLLAAGSGGASTGIPTSAEDFHKMVEASPNRQLVVAILQAAQVHVQMKLQSRALLPSNAVNVEVAPSSLVNAPVVPVPSTSYVKQTNEAFAENIEERDWKSLPLKKRKQLYVPKKPANDENARPDAAAVEKPKKRMRILRTPRVSRAESWVDEESYLSPPVTIVRKTDFELYKEEARKALKIDSPPEAGRQSARIAEKKQSKVLTTIYMLPADEMCQEEFMFHLGLMKV